MEVATELEALYEAKIAKLTEFSKDLQVKLDDTKALAAAREAELLGVNEATKRKIVEHCKDMLTKSTMRQTDLQVLGLWPALARVAQPPHCFSCCHSITRGLTLSFGHMCLRRCRVLLVRSRCTSST
jgi:hypothetical protein